MQKLTPRAVIFDLGSTLIEYESIPWDQMALKCAEAARQFLLSLDIDLPPQDEFIDRFDTVRRELRQEAITNLNEYTVPQASRILLEQLNIEFNDDLISAMFAAYYKRVRDGLYIYTDTIDTLDMIRDAGKTIGLISNTIFPEATHQREIEYFGIKPYFEYSIFSSTFGKRKPHSDIFLKAVELAGCKPEEAVYIGDRYIEDITGPHSIGMPAILKLKKDREYPPEMPLATRRIISLSELGDHIDLG